MDPSAIRARTPVEMGVRRAAAAILLTAAGPAWLGACAGDDSPELTVPLARAPYMGVTCDGRPNWIGCDRVGLYVYLTRRVARLDASIEGLPVPMTRAGGGPDAEHDWEGFLRPAGLIDGPLEVRPDRGRYYWFGRTPVSGRVRLTVFDADGKSVTRTLRVRLAAGYG